MMHIRRMSAAPTRTVAMEEESAWVLVYCRVADPAIAGEVIGQLDADAELRRGHPALYLLCRESLRRHKARLARRRRIRAWLRRFASAIGTRPRAQPRSEGPGHRRASELIATMAGEPRLHGATPAPNPRFETNVRANAKAA